MRSSCRTPAPVASSDPVAEARGNEFLTRYVRVGSAFQLDGTHSYSADCTLTYSWTMVSRPAGSATAISAPGSAQPSFVPDRAGDYVIDLVVGDSSGTSDPVRITLSAITGGPYPLPAKNADKWMTLTPKIMDNTLPQISLPGTDDSGAYWLDACDDENCRGPDFKVWWDSGEWLLHAAKGDLTGFRLFQTLTANWQIGAFAGTCKASRCVPAGSSPTSMRNRPWSPRPFA